jgi:GT2 family glycosyltransferase
MRNLLQVLGIRLEEREIDMAPLVSICLPNFNTRQYLDARMESILAQTFCNWELIVCDSHSDDGAWAYFEQFRNDHRVRLFQVPREGLFAGWNECLKRVSGQYVYIATSDDTAYPENLAKLLFALERVPEAGLAVGKFDFIDHYGKVIEPTQGIPGTFFKDWQERAHRRSGWVDFLVHTQIGTSWTSITSALFRADVVRKAGFFRTDVVKGEAFADRFWAMKVASLADTVYIPDRVATWRVHPGQASRGEAPGWRAKNLRMTEETIRECEERIPVRWKQDPQWMDKLLFGMRQYCLQEFGLDRVTMRKLPKHFLQGMASAAIKEPRYLLRRLASGLSWQAPEMRNPHDVVQSLISEWGVPWPPEPVVI